LLTSLKSSAERFLPKSAFARGVGTLVGGTAGAQLIGIAAAPILTRLYSPEDFGMLAVFAGLLAMVLVVSSLRYELAIPLPEDDREAAHVVALSLLLVVVTAGLSAIVVGLFSSPIARAVGSPSLAGCLWLLPIAVLLGGAYSVFSYWSVRTKSFTVLATTKVRQALAALAIQLAAFKLGSVGLIAGQVAGHSVGTASLALPALAKLQPKNIKWPEIKSAATRYRKFPIFSTWEGLSNSAGVQLPPIMFAAFFSPAAAGLYSLANRVLSLPMSLIGSAVGQVFFAQAAEAHRQGRLGTLVEKLHGKLAHIGLPPALLLILVGPDLFALVFGPAWRVSGEFARWMVPWLYLVFVSSPLSTLFAAVERQDQGLVFQVVLLVARITAIVFGAWIGDLKLTVILFASVSALCWLGFLFWVARTAGNSARSMVAPTLSALGLALACAAPLIACVAFSNTWPMLWLAGLAASGLLVIARYGQLLRAG
jgi:O-antigen/teichoic acid export membrane protein